MPVNATPVSYDGSPELVVIADGNYVICTRMARMHETVYTPHWLDKRCPKSTEDKGRKAPPISGKDLAAGIDQDREIEDQHHTKPVAQAS